MALKHKMLFTFILITSCWGCSLVDEGGGSGSFERVNMMWDGEARSYVLYRPDSYTGDQAVPLVLGFHGSQDSGQNFASAIELAQEADRLGFIAAFPDALVGNWAEACGCNNADRLNIDDKGFTLAIMDSLSAQFRIDPDRIYALGFSQGALYTQRLACELPDRFAALATVGATMSVPLSNRCKRGTPVSMLMMHGTRDPIFPWAGTNNGDLSVLSAPDVLSHWARRNACSYETGDVVDEPVGENGRYDRVRFNVCERGTHVQFYTLQGAGHVWPKSELRASTVIADFFMTQTRK